MKEHRKVIIDNSMAFFAEPLMFNDVYNIYSPRKFFAVPDGGYVIGNITDEIPLERDQSYKRARTLLESLELGEEAAYKEQIANEQALFPVRKRMSGLTEKMLSSIDYEIEKKARRTNFDILDKHIGSLNRYSIKSEEAVPQFYPLLVNVDIRNILISHNIYSPMMWRRLISEQFIGTAERLFSERMLYLPIDQRYSPQDMEYIADTITSLLT